MQTRKEKYEFIEILVGPDCDLLTFYFSFVTTPECLLEEGEPLFLPGNPVDHRHYVYLKKWVSGHSIGTRYRDYSMKSYFTGTPDDASVDKNSRIVLLCEKCALRIVLPERPLSEEELLVHLQQRYMSAEYN